MSEDSIVKTLVRVFDELRGMSGRKEKLDRFKEFFSNTATSKESENQLMTLLNLIYSGQITFGLSGIPEKIRVGSSPVHIGQIVTLLRRLASRELSGSAAKDAVVQLLTGAEMEFLEFVSIALRKDPKCGFGVSSVNACLPGGAKISIFGQHKAESIMRDQDNGLSTMDLSLLPDLPQYQVEIKYDGNRAYLVCPADQNKDPFFLSANGLEFPAMASLAKKIRDLGHLGGCRGCVFDGELFLDSLEKTRSVVSKQDDQGLDTGIRFYTMGALPLPDWMASFHGPSSQTTGQMRANLRLLEWTPELQKFMIPTQCKMVSGCDKHKAIPALMSAAVAAGFEGLVIKDPNQVYTRHKEEFRGGWWKCKFVDLYDARIVDVVEGKGKFKGSLGAFVVEYKGVRGNVGGGVKRKDTGSSLSDSMRLELWLRRGELADRIIRVQSYGLTKDGSFRHAAFVDFHDQK